MLKIGEVILTLCVAAACFGQETSGVSTTQTTGAVMKGKAPVAASLIKIRFPKPQSFVLNNGLQVYVLADRRLPIVRFQLLLRAGAVDESKAGVSRLTAAMLTEGTAAKSYTQIAEEEEANGISLNASSTLDQTSVVAAGLSEATDQMLNLMSDVLLHPSFPVSRLDRVKFAQRSAIAQRITNPNALVAELSSQVFYGGTPYGRLSPTRQDLAVITAEDLQKFHDSQYLPDRAILGVTGWVETSTLKRRLEAAFGGWKRSGISDSLPEAHFAKRDQSRIYLIDRPGSAQSVLQFGSIAVSQADPDYIPLVVANRILGGGSSGRLFQQIRERKGYTYGAYSTLPAVPWPAVWGAGASVRTEVTEPAIGEFLNEFARLRTQPVSEAELSSAKRSIVGGFALTLQTPETILARTLDQVQNHLPATYWDTYSERIGRVTASDVQRVANKYLGLSQVQVLVIGERSRIEAGLAKYGPVQVIDPAKMDDVAR